MVQALLRIKKLDFRDPFTTNFDIYVKITQALYKQDSKSQCLEHIVDRQNNLRKKIRFCGRNVLEKGTRMSILDSRSIPKLLRILVS